MRTFAVPAISAAPIAPDEYIEIGELAACQRLIEDLGARLAA